MSISTLFDPKNVTITLNNQTIDGFKNGIYISLSRENEQRVPFLSREGDVAWVVQANRQWTAVTLSVVKGGNAYRILYNLDSPDIPSFNGSISSPYLEGNGDSTQRRVLKFTITNACVTKIGDSQFSSTTDDVTIYQDITIKGFIQENITT